ncbi:30S ribosomal protein S6--L-glutamate ligase [Desulfotalea psychrophila]|uniref:Probable alpha-L-glutamate ligase n=1 Tax=Desulfotalea psychrophila (strain LSv54 / DSM 12343) TaxID=177439 RepID=RIMK_DESPS|nr:30S ribosomal protein S6--L-glutamate ligase [Desulfotalea psychrophila]Q6AKK4.1 RecName: Full=Probable alpha-L-glutamate ligase [Desulfotalea psychrophila LSv54]CAG37121.1 probable ribosomal protein S6 modification protein (RimK) [Desulfotalea psychrophila LSv54]
MSQDIAKKIIGSEEWCSFPELGIPAIKARVDSGAKTSSIHAVNIQTFQRDGEEWVSFEVHPLRIDRRTVVRCQRPVIDKRIIKNSSGNSETRFVIRTPLKLNKKVWDIELTLSNRDAMGFRMLLGREAMMDRLIIDPALQCALGEVSKESLGKAYTKEETRKGGLKIGILACNESLYGNQRLLEAGRERGHEMLFLDIKQCYLKLDTLEPEVHYKGRLLNDLDAVLTKIGSNITPYATALSRQFESMGIYTCNSSSAISQSGDKLFSLQLLLKSGINIPITGFANSPIDASDLIEMVGGAPLIIKLLEGGQGQGPILAKTKNAAESLINTFKFLRANLLVQQFIKEANGKILRCLVINGKVVASIERTAASGELSSNTHQDGKSSIVKITPEERSLALKAAKVLGLQIASVDIINSKAGPLLLEVNSSPELEGIEIATGKDIAGMVISSIEKKLQWKRPLPQQS